MLADSGCPLGRHELRDHEWLMLGIIRSERDKIISEESKKNTPPFQGGAGGE